MLRIDLVDTAVNILEFDKRADQMVQIGLLCVLPFLHDEVRRRVVFEHAMFDTRRIRVCVADHHAAQHGGTHSQQKCAWRRFHQHAFCIFARAEQVRLEGVPQEAELVHHDATLCEPLIKLDESDALHDIHFIVNGEATEAQEHCFDVRLTRNAPAFGATMPDFADQLRKQQVEASKLLLLDATATFIPHGVRQCVSIEMLLHIQCHAVFRILRLVFFRDRLWMRYLRCI
mmetsp:Transcript_56514/g.90020  ORF Transcript_56514/g.90020 Transcript_56514/m.90020 type:complete len:230 (+) Transcript_56514:159-848(+)